MIRYIYVFHLTSITLKQDQPKKFDCFVGEANKKTEDGKKVRTTKAFGATVQHSKLFTDLSEPTKAGYILFL